LSLFSQFQVCCRSQNIRFKFVPTDSIIFFHELEWVWVIWRKVTKMPLCCFACFNRVDFATPIMRKKKIYQTGCKLQKRNYKIIIQQQESLLNILNNNNIKPYRYLTPLIILLSKKLHNTCNLC
jgi:hypothetical protein